jgi:multisubunit Na+/H+ antiporter MnhE subunit
MEHPIKTILKAFGIVLLAALIFYAVPQISRAFGKEEWLLTIGFFILFAVLMLLQVYASSSKLMKKLMVQPNPSQQ